MGGSVNGVRSGYEDDHTVWGSPAFIERDQFVYFVTMARELGDPADWSSFRNELVAALTAAWGLDTIWLDVPADVQQRRTTERLGRVFALVDDIRARHDPLSDWPQFFNALWDARSQLHA